MTALARGRPRYCRRRSGSRQQRHCPDSTYLVLILGLAARMGLRESLTASILSMAAYNFYFLPPVGNFTIADPQNLVALLAYSRFDRSQDC